MRFKSNHERPGKRHPFPKALAFGMLALVLSVIGFTNLQAQTVQEKQISLDLKNVSLIQVFDAIKSQSNYSFWYRNDDIDANEKVSITVNQKTVSEILNQVLQNKNLKYEIKEKQIIISKSTTSPSSTDSQQKGIEIKGSVVGDNGDPIIGGSVKVKGKETEGTITDIDGNYTLRLNDPKAVLVFSYIGYKPVEKSIGNQTKIHITLEEDTKLLDEVVVTGYQTISRERATGSFAILTRAELDKNIILEGSRALEGRVAGVSTYSNNVVIRGISSLNLSSDPLIVIDGLPTEISLNSMNTNNMESITILKDAAATSIYGVRAANGVIVITTKKGKEGKAQINFSSTYTMRETASLSDYRYASTSDVLDYAEQLYQAAVRNAPGGTEQAYFNNQKIIGSGTGSISYFSPYNELHRQLMLGNITQSQFTNTVDSWRKNDYRQEYLDEFNQTPISQSYNLSLSKATSGTNTYLSVNYTNNNHQDVKSAKNEAVKAYLKSSIDITKWFKADVSLDVRYGTSSSKSNPGFTGLEPYSRLFNEDGTRAYRDWVGFDDGFSETSGGSMNPIVLEQIAALNTTTFKSFKYNAMDERDKNHSSSNSNTIRSLVSLNFKLLKGLNFNPSFAYESNNSSSQSFTDGESYSGRFLYNRFINYNEGTKKYESAIPALGGRFQRNRGSNYNYTFRAQLNYDKDIKEVHNLVALAGTEWREERNPLGLNKVLFGYDPQTLSYTMMDDKTMSTGGVGYPSYINGKNFNIPLQESLGDKTNRYIAFYGNVGYTFDNRYGVTGSFRIDQTNLFGTDPKYRYRPLWSVGATWNASNEAFLQDMGWMNLLKLRASYGVAGMVDKSSSPYLLGRYLTAGVRIEPTRVVHIAEAPNPTLRWERTTSYDFGIDYSVLKNTLSGTIDFYYKYSDDLLAGKSLDFSSGFSTGKVNNGAMSNTGFEFTVKSPWLNKNDWKLNSTLIFSWNKNEIKKVGMKPRTAADLIAVSDYFMAGLPRSTMYAYRYGGLTSGMNDVQSGIPYVIREDGTSNVVLKEDGTTVLNTIILPSDVYYVGTATPTYNFSFNQGVKFKDFELNALLMFYGGHKIRKPSLSINQSGAGGALPEEITQGWTPENRNTGYPKLFPYYNSQQNSMLNSVDDYWRMSDTHITGAEFLSLRNISLSYSLPRKYCQAVWMQQCKISLQARDLWMWSAAGDGINPEGRGKNVTDRQLPAMASYFLRLDISF